MPPEAPDPRGGARQGAGRHRLPDPIVTRPIGLTNAHLRIATLIGQGNASLGVRRALDAYTPPKK